MNNGLIVSPTSPPREPRLRRRDFNLSAALAFAWTIFGVALFPGLAISAPAAAQRPPIVVALGDSLMAGYGLAPGQSVPDQLTRMLQQKGFRLSMLNAGVSGDTTAGGLRRVDWVLGSRPDIVLVALGANDMLRGVNPEYTRANLDAILTKLSDRKVKVLLIGMQAPANFGVGYIDSFNRIFPDLARKHGTALYPFLLQGVALHPALNLPDGMHPNAQGAAVIARNLLPFVANLLQSLR